MKKTCVTVVLEFQSNHRLQREDIINFVQKVARGLFRISSEGEGTFPQIKPTKKNQIITECLFRAIPPPWPEKVLAIQGYC